MLVGEVVVVVVVGGRGAHQSRLDERDHWRLANGQNAPDELNRSPRRIERAVAARVGLRQRGLGEPRDRIIAVVSAASSTKTSRTGGIPRSARRRRRVTLSSFIVPSRTLHANRTSSRESARRVTGRTPTDEAANVPSNPL